MRLTILGSGTLVPDHERHSAAHLVQVEGASVLFDCGAGTLHGMDRHGIDWRGLTHVALSHFHTDHVGDLAPLLFALTHGVRPPRRRPLEMLGPPGLGRFLSALAEAHGDFVLEPGFPVRVRELEVPGAWDDPGGRFRLRCRATPHTEASVAWRIEGEAGAVGYTGDTGADPELAVFFAGCDVLVSECSVPDAAAGEAGVENHLSPRQVAAMASGARPGLLLLTHLFPMLDPAAVPDLIHAAGYTGTMRVARDGDAVDVSAAREGT